MTDHEELRNLLRAILGELRVANEIAMSHIEPEGETMGPYGKMIPVYPSVFNRIDQIREEHNQP